MSREEELRKARREASLQFSTSSPVSRSRACFSGSSMKSNEHRAAPIQRYSSSGWSERIETGPLTVRDGRPPRRNRRTRSGASRRPSSCALFPAGLRAALEGRAAGTLDAHRRGVPPPATTARAGRYGHELQPAFPPVPRELDRDRAVLRVDVHVSSAARHADGAVDSGGGDGARAGLERDRAVLRLRPYRPGGLLEGKRAVLRAGGDLARHPAHGDGAVVRLEVEAGAARRPDNQVHGQSRPSGPRTTISLVSSATAIRERSCSAAAALQAVTETSGRSVPRTKIRSWMAPGTAARLEARGRRPSPRTARPPCPRRSHAGAGSYRSGRRAPSRRSRRAGDAFRFHSWPRLRPRPRQGEPPERSRGFLAFHSSTPPYPGGFPIVGSRPRGIRLDRFLPFLFVRRRKGRKVRGFGDEARSVNVSPSMQQLAFYVSKYGLSLIFVNVLVEQLGMPIPAIPVLVAVAGALAVEREPLGSPRCSARRGSSPPSFADALWYELGRRYGFRIFEDPVPRLSLARTPASGKRLRSSRSGGCPSLMVAKFVPGFSTVAPPLAGAISTRGLSTFLPLRRRRARSSLGGSRTSTAGIVFHRAIDRALEFLTGIGSRALVILGARAASLRRRSSGGQRRRFYKMLRMARISPREELQAA